MTDIPKTDESSVEPPSKSERKRQMLALQELGERLVGLSESELAKVPIDDERLRDAVITARRVTARGGLKRQLQFIGKLMRSTDPEPISRSLAALDKQHRNQTAAFHRIEAARDDLRSRGDEAIGGILSMWPKAEVSWLRQWVRQQPKELARGSERAHSRKLHRYLTELAASAPEEL